jgi:hypothetical protein
MADVNQYTITNKELVELIIKQAGVHEGKWSLMVNIGLAPGNFGPSPDQVAPGAAVIFQQAGIQRADANAPTEMLVDAAIVNPKPKKK